MTAVCASPIVRSTCSPVSERSRRDGRLLLEHPRQGRPHLVEVALALTGSMATSSDGAGNSSGGRRSGLLLGRERVAGLGDGELRDRADLAGLELADRLLLLAVEQQQLADPLVLVARWCSRRGPASGACPESTRRYVSRPTNGSAVVLNTRTSSGTAVVGRDLDLGTALVDRRDRRLVGRGGEIADDRVEQRAQADPLRRGADEDRREDALLDALAQACLELGVGDLLALEVLREHVVVGLGRGLEELVPPRRHLVGELVGDRDLDLVRAVPSVCLAMDEVDVARRTSRRRRSRSGAARSCRRRLARSASSAAVGSAFSRSHLLMKKQAAVPVLRPRATACSRPASTPAEASITKSAPSAAAKPSITSATKSG